MVEKLANGVKTICGISLVSQTLIRVATGPFPEGDVSSQGGRHRAEGCMVVETLNCAAANDPPGEPGETPVVFSLYLA